MHRTEKGNHVRIIVVGFLGILTVIGLIFLLTGHITSSPSEPAAATQTTISAVPVAIAQPPTAAQVAAQLNCGRFQDRFKPGEDPAVIDVGVCWIGNVKYAINTFASSESRDAWLKLAGMVGVIPKWETPTSVTYKSVG